MTRNNWKWIPLALLVFLPLLGGASAATTDQIRAKTFRGKSGLPVGVRQNNPGNLRNFGDPWQGVIPGSKAFYEFEGWIWGVRAMVRTIRNYIRQGHDTPRKIVSRYCPASDCVPGDPGGTERYIKFVTQKTGIPENAPISADDRAKISKLVRAMAQMEVWDTAAYPALLQYFSGPDSIITTAEINYAWDVLGA